MKFITAFGATDSPARSVPSTREHLRVGLVQHRWRDDAAELEGVLDQAIGQIADAGGKVAFLPELTLSKYPADQRADANPARNAEHLTEGRTFRFAAEAAARHNILVHASLYERADESDGLGFNTAILVAPNGDLLGRTRKLHIPVSAGYYEDTYFRPGPSADPYPVYTPPGLNGATLGMPTCWDEWFPEVARAYSLAGAEILVYPTAIGSEPTFPAFNTQPLWQQVIVGHGISNGTFMVVPNRTGDEGEVAFYGSSFISDPYGRIVAQAPRDEEAAVVVDLDLDQRRDWLDLFPFLATRRPDTYGVLGDPVDEDQPHGRGVEQAVAR
ncbi:N-carbamoylputrescine amidase [Arthrobacter pigmenti]|uniref:N-carbamoylputrescine amidase n=1 Tax=Arthrobacter pigmenti TaxID=271432 RepID=A0A846RUE4_9MICC|nr:nitrilase-related carbon-nitrogen hydrolase [Arthrobacter pigmenti]NJC24174.1 N-carbamoylputrescine amidase [Arthrobacter pigmenti]